MEIEQKRVSGIRERKADAHDILHRANMVPAMTADARLVLGALLYECGSPDQAWCVQATTRARLVYRCRWEDGSASESRVSKALRWLRKEGCIRVVYTREPDDVRRHMAVQVLRAPRPGAPARFPPDKPPVPITTPRATTDDGAFLLPMGGKCECGCCIFEDRAVCKACGKVQPRAAAAGSVALPPTPTPGLHASGGGPEPPPRCMWFP